MPVDCSQPSHRTPERAPVIKATLYVGFQDVFLSSERSMDLLDGIMASPSWSETIAVRLKCRLPFWFQDHFR